MPHHDVLIIGAGLAGLTAAAALASDGKQVLLVDKGRSVGGRLATRRIGAAVLDHGAQFFTARSEEFSRVVDSWQADGVISEWCRGFDQADGYPRYRSTGGMNQLAKYLESTLPEGVDVATSAAVNAVMSLGDRYAVTYEGSNREPDEATAVIITSPVPQSLALLRSGGLKVPASISDGLDAIRYHSVVALLTTLSEPAPFGPTGARQQPDDPIFTFCADNQIKGISPVPAATFHTAHALSSELFDKTDDEILERLRPEAERLLEPATIESIQIMKWRFAGPVEPWPERCVVIESTSSTGAGPVVLCGDAFGGPKVEGAHLSGAAAATAMSKALLP